MAYAGQMAAGSGAGAAPQPAAAQSAPAKPAGPPPVPPRPRALTVSMPAGVEHRVSQPTGSVPLIDERHAALLANSAQSPARQLPGDFPEDPSFESSVAGEEHSEAIAKILTETDVYVKYGLKDKAIEHLRRVFELDAANVEARERLKDLLIAQGRRDEAVAELMQLAELSISYNRDRASACLREILGINGNYRPAFDLAKRHGIQLDGVRVIAAVEETRPGIAAALEEALEFSDLDIEIEEASRPDGDTRIITPKNSLLRSRVPGLEVTISESVDTAVLSLDDVEIDGPATLMGGDADVALDADSFASGLDTAIGANTEIIDLKQAEADIFGGEPVSDILEAFTSSSSISISEGEGVPTRVMQAFDLDDEFSIDMEEFETSTAMEPAADDIAALYNQTKRPGTQSGGKGAGGIDDDLDEADFFVAQSLYDSAREILQNVLATHPNHPLILAKLEEIDEMERGAGAKPARDEQVAAASPDDSTIDRASRKLRKPAVMLEKPVEDEDADTHYDLGLAYKEMGLYEEAIQEFEKVLPIPHREVQCRLMMGLCFREHGDVLSAINQFKAGLHAPSINPTEQLSLYYEIAISYETGVDDPHEALYFYELIQKRDRDYRDLQTRIVACREKSTHREKGRQDSSANDVDAAVDSLLAESDSHGRQSR
jgi:tetratricopeptide (TPR) repeat protein